MNIYSILPRDKKYPTGQIYRINAFAKEIKRRTRSAYVKARRYAEQLLPALVVNYKYELDPMRSSQINAYIQALLNEEIFGNHQGLWSEGWWANVYASGAYQQGTGQSVQQAQILVSDAGIIQQVPSIQMMTIQSVLMEPSYQLRLRNVYGRVFEGVTGYTGEQKKILADTITKGMAAGKSPRIIAKEISQKTGAIEWKALRLAATEINTAFNKATLDEADQLNDTVFDASPYAMRVMHISSLLVTTRPDHGRRHGTICTPAEQNEWWDTKAVGSRVNCHCSAVDILVNKKTGEVMQKRLVEVVKAQKKEYFSE